MAQRVVVLDALTDETEGAEAGMEWAYELIHPYCSATEFDDRGRLALHEESGKRALQLFSALVAGLQEKTGGTIVENAEFIPSESGEERAVRMALPAVSDRHCIQTALAIYGLCNRIIEGRQRGEEVADIGREIQAAENKLRALITQQQNPRALIRAAHRLDIPYLDLPGSLIQFGYGCDRLITRSTTTGITPVLGVAMARQKDRANQLLGLAGFPVARQIPARTEAEVMEAAQIIGFPVVLKPVDQSKGQGVICNINSKIGLKRAYKQVAEVSDRMLVEEFVEGESFRIHIVRGEIAWTRLFLPAQIVGDGERSVKALIAEENENPKRSPGPEQIIPQIRLDQTLKDVLFNQGLDLISVPEKGQRVSLSHAGNVAQGAEPVNVFDFHPDNTELALAGARLLGLDTAGVDMIIPDYRKSYTEVGGIICEINSQPQYPLREGVMFDKFLNAYCGKDFRVGLEITSEPAKPMDKGLAADLFDVEARHGVIRMDAESILEEGIPVDRIHALSIADDGLATGATSKAVAAIAGFIRGPVVMSVNHPRRAEIEAALDGVQVTLSKTEPERDEVFRSVIASEVGGPAR